MLCTNVMRILGANVKALAGSRHAYIEQLVQLLLGALSGAEADSTMTRYSLYGGSSEIDAQGMTCHSCPSRRWRSRCAC